jgi:hypothetical protein
MLRDLMNNSVDVIRVDSNARAEKKELTPEEIEFYRTASMRYEPDTDTLYIKAQVAKELYECGGYETLRLTDSFICSKLTGFYKGTPYKGAQCQCHIYDLSKKEELRADRLNPPEHEYKKTAARMRRRYRNDVALVARAMDEWVEQYRERMIRGEHMAHNRKTEEELERERMMRRIRTLERKILHRAKPKEKAQRVTLSELDNYIAEHKPFIRRTVVKIEKVDGKYVSTTKRYNPEDYKRTYVGRFEDIENTMGGRSIKLHLQVAALKLSVPNFKQDVRYTHSQKTRISEQPNAAQDWCAVFDLTRK